mmetsp:Transcript_44537/g.50435  ORF Transcript_44537/g.50435 Transcript_44537/m.50435 type:complete len:508 (-) Transcript_44537:8-1531(-)
MENNGEATSSSDEEDGLNSKGSEEDSSESEEKINDKVSDGGNFKTPLEESEDDEDEEEEEGSDDNDDGHSDDNDEEEEKGSDDNDDGHSNDNDDSIDDDDYDYDRGEISEGFEDEEMNPYDISETDDGEKTNIDEWWEGHEKIIAVSIACCCCLCLIIIGVIVGVVMGIGNNGNNEDLFEGINQPQPTLRPTLAPQPLPPSALVLAPSIEASPTEAPTISLQPAEITTSPTTQSPTINPTINPTFSFAPTKPIPETIGIIANQDTYIILDGELQGEEYGDLDTILVQNGPLAEEMIPDAIGLISFPLVDVPSIGRLNNNGNNDKNAVLRLTHLVSTSEKDSATYTIIRLPETRMAVEYLHGFSFLPPQDDHTDVMVGPTFDVNPDDTNIDIDISSLLFDYYDTQQTEEDIKKQQQEQEQNLLLMITNRGPEQDQGGDRFYARETKTPPQLLIDLIGGNASDITISIDDVVNERPGNSRFIDLNESNSTDRNGIGDADSDSDSDAPLL